MDDFRVHRFCLSRSTSFYWMWFRKTLRSFFRRSRNTLVQRRPIFGFVFWMGTRKLNLLLKTNTRNRTSEIHFAPLTCWDHILSFTCLFGIRLELSHWRKLPCHIVPVLFDGSRLPFESFIFSKEMQILYNSMCTKDSLWTSKINIGTEWKQ